jgi:DNA replication initiation complex subunit (GINS family)
MALSKKQSNIINKIKLYNSIANSNIVNTTFDDLIPNTNDPIDFLLDIIKITAGDNTLETVTQKVLSKVIKQRQLDILSDKIYESLGKNISESSSLPNQIKQNGITIPIKSFDTTDSFRKINITGSTASKNANKFFDNMTKNVLTSPNVEVSLPGISATEKITVKYNEQNNNATVKFPDVNQAAIFGILEETIGPLFSADVVINEIMNILFRIDYSKEDAQLLTLVRSYTKYENKDIFKLDLKKLLDLELDSEIKGLNVDTSCFRENIEITQKQIDAVIQAPTIENFNALVPELNTETTGNFKNDYHKSILKAIIEALLMMILKQPGVLFFTNIFKKILNPDFDFSTSISIPDILQNFKKVFENVFDEIYKDIFCVIFNFIKKYIIKLVVNVSIQFLREQLEKRGKILESLSGLEVINRLKTII